MVIRVENLLGKNITTKLGVSNYKTSEATGEKLTPHLMMRKALDVFERRPFIHAGINQMISFISGKGLFAESDENDSENKKGIAFMNEWLKQRKSNLELVKYQLILTYLVQGNAYIEQVFRPNSAELDNVFAVYDASRVYYNNDYKDADDYWLFRVADDINAIKWRGVNVSLATYQPYKYSPSSVYFGESIKAFHLSKKKLKHLRVPYTMDGFYGYSFMMSTLDDEEAINKIIRNIILISSNKAIGKKIIGFTNENGKTIPEKDIEDLQDQIDFDVGSNLIVNKKFQVEDLAHNGTYDTMINEIEYLTKDVGSGLTPSYMTPWNSEVNRATAEQARLPFIVTTEKIKQQVEEFFNDVIMTNLRVEYKFLDNVKITFGETQYFSLEERKNFYGELYNSNIITMNQYLSVIDMKPVKNGDIYARDREALLDMKYQNYGSDKFEDVGAGTKPQYSEKLKEGVEDLHTYEFDEEERDSADNAKKQVIDMTDEITQIVNRNLK